MNLLELTKRSAFLSLFIITTFFISCENPKDIGLTTQQSPNDQIGVSFDDSFDLQPQITLLDSFQTSNSLSLMVGKYKDPTFGDVTSQAFADVQLSLEPDSTANLAGENRVFKSLTLRIVLNYNYGVDLSQDRTPQTINIYELKDSLINRTYSNNEVAEYDATRLLATTTFIPQDAINSDAGAVEFTITDPSYTQRFFDILNKGTTTNDEFVNAIKGLAFVPAATNTVMLGFNRPLSRITMIYSAEVNATAQDNEYSVFFINDAFNNVTSENRTGELANLTTVGQEITAGNVLYGQSGVGIATKIDLVNVLKLKSQGAVSINRAELIFSPKLETINSTKLPIPSHLLLAEANGTRLNKASNGVFEFAGNEETSGTDNFRGNLTVYNDVFKHYTFNITGYLQAVLGGTRGSQLFILPSFPTDFSNVSGLIGGSSVTRVLLNNDASSDRKIRLRVFYIVIKQ